jgi:ABC-2 type transport system ATP-binding protein
LKKNYGAVQALRGVDLEVKRGEIFGFLGPNGAGKTTTIRCLLDLIRPNAGSLRVLGLDPQANPVAVRGCCGYLPGELHFEDGLTVEAALRYLGELRGKPLDKEFVRRLAQRLDLDLKPQIKNLSKGNKQKVGEPTSGLDPLAQHAVLEMVGKACRAGATAFFSSHNISEVQEIANRVAIIRAGTIVEVADPQALLRRALRRMVVRFARPVDAAALARLAALPGVRLLEPAKAPQMAGEGGSASTPGGVLSVQMQIEGEMDALVKALAVLPVSDLETECPTLEEVFIANYESPAGQGG